MSILTRVQTNPEIGTYNETFVEELIVRAKAFVTLFCKYPSYPELSQGYAKSAVSASIDITAIGSNNLYVTVNDSAPVSVDIDLSACDTGDNIATELQTKIRAASDSYGFDEVTVTYDSDNIQYTITSGRYGLISKVRVGYYNDTKHVCQNLKLNTSYGATEVQGNVDNESLQDATVMLVEMKYRQLGLEGVKQGSVPSGVSFTSHNIDPTLLSLLLANRRLF